MRPRSNSRQPMVPGRARARCKPPPVAPAPCRRATIARQSTRISRSGCAWHSAIRPRAASSGDHQHHRRQQRGPTNRPHSSSFQGSEIWRIAIRRVSRRLRSWLFVAPICPGRPSWNARTEMPGTSLLTEARRCYGTELRASGRLSAWAQHRRQLVDGKQYRSCKIGSTTWTRIGLGG